MQFRWNLQLLIRYCIFRNLPCSTTNLLTVKADRVSVAPNTSGVTWTIALCFDRIEYTTSPHHKIKFYFVYGKLFLLIESFLSSRRLWVFYKYKSSSESAISSGMRQNSFFFFFYFNCVPNDVSLWVVIWS